MSKNEYRFYGWDCSPFSAKVKSYLQYKGIPFKETRPTIFHFQYVIQKKVGRKIIPIVETPEGAVIQDSTEIIHYLEANHPTPSIFLEDPVLNMANHLLEILADEWMVLPALHYRWNFPRENSEFIHKEFGRSALPFFPGPVQSYVGKTVGKKMQRYLPILGINKKLHAPLEEWTEGLLKKLNTHFKVYPYLLGERPTLADFSFFGPISTHYFHDPYPKKNFGCFEKVKSWIERMFNPKVISGNKNSEAVLSSEIEEIIIDYFKEFFPHTEKVIHSLQNWAKDYPAEKKPPKGLGKAPFKLKGIESERLEVPFSQWMIQWPFDYFNHLDDANKSKVKQALGNWGGEGLLNLPIKKKLGKNKKFQLYFD